MKTVQCCQYTLQLTSLPLCFSLNRKDYVTCEALYDFKPIFGILLLINEERCQYCLLLHTTSKEALLSTSIVTTEDCPSLVLTTSTHHVLESFKLEMHIIFCLNKLGIHVVFCLKILYGSITYDSSCISFQFV